MIVINIIIFFFYSIFFGEGITPLIAMVGLFLTFLGLIFGGVVSRFKG